MTPKFVLQNPVDHSIYPAPVEMLVLPQDALLFEAELFVNAAGAGADAGLPLHLGLHAGDVTREKDPDGPSNVYGGAVNIASRISGLSAAEVLVSDTVRSLARTSAGVTFEDSGEQALKGVGEAVRVWAVVAQ